CTQRTAGWYAGPERAGGLEEWLRARSFRSITRQAAKFMRITRIEAISLLRRLDQPFMGGTYEVTNRNTLVTRVHTDAGIIGEAFGGDEDRNQHRIVALIREHLAPRLIGEDARDVERLWEAMFFSDVDLGNRGLHVHDLANRAILMQAIAAIDIA